jgi:MFS family permease
MSSTTTAAGTQPYKGRLDSTADAVYRKVGWRLIPLLFLCYIVAYLDRVNVGFAKLQMQGDLQFSEAVYGLGAGIFFIGYFLFEVPSNVVLHRVGARRWIARIMITWGVLSAATMFVNSPTSFYVIRFLLGAAEAGFFPASSCTSPTGTRPRGAARRPRCFSRRSRSRASWAARSRAGSCRAWAA